MFNAQDTGILDTPVRYVGGYYMQPMGTIAFTTEDEFPRYRRQARPGSWYDFFECKIGNGWPGERICYGPEGQHDLRLDGVPFEGAIVYADVGEDGSIVSYEIDEDGAPKLVGNKYPIALKKKHLGRVTYSYAVAIVDEGWATMQVAMNDLRCRWAVHEFALSSLCPFLGPEHRFWECEFCMDYDPMALVPVLPRSDPIQCYDEQSIPDLNTISPEQWRAMNDAERWTFYSFWARRGIVSFRCLACGYPTVHGQVGCEACRPRK